MPKIHILLNDLKELAGERGVDTDERIGNEFVDVLTRASLDADPAEEIEVILEGTPSQQRYLEMLLEQIRNHLSAHENVRITLVNGSEETAHTFTIELESWVNHNSDPHSEEEGENNEGDEDILEDDHASRSEVSEDDESTWEPEPHAVDPSPPPMSVIPSASSYVGFFSSPLPLSQRNPVYVGFSFSPLPLSQGNSLQDSALNDEENESLGYQDGPG